MTAHAELQKEIKDFASEIGSSDPVTVVGGRTQWTIGGNPDPSAREVSAPSGVWSHEPEEMTVRCGAGTSLRTLSEQLAVHDQMVPFDLNPDATVGGSLSVGVNGFRRLRYGPIRDFVLQVRYVDHSGKIVTSGGPTVKNVSGYDLCRLLVGSLGKLGCLAELTLRCLPLPATSRWLTGEADPFELYRTLYRPSSILWNGTQVWVCLEGVTSDVDAQANRLDLIETEGPPELPTGGRLSLEPKSLTDLAHLAPGWIAEVGVGAVHCRDSPPPRAVSDVNNALMRELEQRLDPSGRLNPGRQVLTA